MPSWLILIPGVPASVGMLYVSFLALRGKL